MSFREKIRLNLPSYLVLSLVFSVAVWSLWLPKWFSGTQNAFAAPITSFSSYRTAVAKVPAASQPKLIYNNGVYAMVFSSSTATGSPTTTCANVNSGAGAVQQCGMYFTSSNDGGVTWGTPVLVTGRLFYSANREAISDFSYDSRRGVYVATYKENVTYDIVQAYSSNGVTWTTSTVLSDNAAVSSNYIGRNVAMAFATSSDLRVILAQKGPYMIIGTTSNSGLATSWPSSTIDRVSGYYDNNAATWDALVRPLGVSIDYNNVIHAVYALSTTTAAGGYEIIYASSSNLGLTWATSSISGKMNIVMSNLEGFEHNIDSAAIDPYTGRLSVLYFQTTAVNGTLIGSGIFAATSSLKSAQLGANGFWTTTTLSTSVPFYYTFDSAMMLVGSHPMGMSVPYTGMYAGAFFSTSSNPYVVINTSTAVIENINSDTIHNMSEMSTAYNSTTKELAVAYVDKTNYQVRFTTTSLRIAAVNAPASTTAITPSFATNASGLVTVSTTVSDANSENVTLYVDYSVDAGTTWTSTTLASATGSVGGTLSTATGRITGISTLSGGQTVTFTWDTSAILAATSSDNIQIRILADDGVSSSGYRQSASFTVDNLAPGIPSSLVLTPDATSIAFSWTASTGTPALYFVSSTALGAASTTVQTVVTSTGLLSNTLYLFQVKAQDAYGNTSSFANTTSTYTNAAVPASVVAVSTGSTSMTVTWSANGNATGTVYELYNSTTGASVATTTDTSLSVTGLTASTAYQFKVKAQYFSDASVYSSYSTDSASVSTDAAPTSSNSSSGSSAMPAPAPAVPVVAPTTAQSVATISLDTNKPKTQIIGASEHTFTIKKMSDARAEVVIQSEPQTLNLELNKPQNIDTNKDGIKDLRVTYQGLVGGKAKIAAINLTDEQEMKNAVTINAGAYETDNRNVQLFVNVPGISQVALSNSADFSGATFATAKPIISWKLEAGSGLKTVYVRLRSAQGGTVTVSDRIIATVASADSVINTPVETPTQTTVPVLTQTRNLSRGTTGDDVLQVQIKLQTLGFFPKNITPNGVYGPTTQSSVKAYQKKNKISQTGTVGPITWKALNK